MPPRGAKEAARPVPHLRDQQRALHAYDVVSTIPETERADYKAAVQDFGADILRSGLCGAVAALQRKKERGRRLLEHLASASVPGLTNGGATELPARVRSLDTAAYMLASREMLRVAQWLKRATQASWESR